MSVTSKESVYFNSFRFNVIILTTLLFVVLKLSVSYHVLLILSTTLFEFFLMYLVFVLTNRKGIFSSIVFYSFYVLNLILIFFHSYFIDEVLMRKDSLLKFDFNIVFFLYESIFPMNLFLLFLLGIVLVFVFCYFVRVPVYSFSKVFYRRVLYFSVCAFLLIPFVFWGQFSNPYTNTLLDLNDFVFKQKISPYSFVPSSIELSGFNKSFPSFRYDYLNKSKVLVFVMEGVEYSDFNLELSLIPKEDNFFKRVKDNTHVYSNYYTSGQGSRTAVMTMLSSRFIPYEAYRYVDWPEVYGYSVFKGKSLVDYLNFNDYYTTYAISSVQIPVEFESYRFKNYVKLNSTAPFSEEYLCLHLLEYQDGCEDLTILSDIENLISSKDKVFLVQELLFGHGMQYENIKKQSRLQYYNNYFTQVYNFLLEKELLDDTLIVVVSDHGPRNFVKNRIIDGYQVPLVFISSDFGFVENSGLFSHVDFKNILMKELGVKRFNPVPSERVFFMGDTGSDYVGFIDNSSFYAILGDVGKNSSYIVKTNYGNVSQIRYNLGIFEYYRKSFK